MSNYSELKKLAEAATPQDFDSAEEKVENGYIECPHCGGSGEVELEADYCNYDNVAIGVQFYGIGHEFGAAEAYYRAASPAAVLALIADRDALAAQRDEGLAREAELLEQRDSLANEMFDLQQRLAEATDLLKHMTCSYHRALENGYDRIIFLGGDCDSVDKMEKDDPFYAKARAFLANPSRADQEQPS